MAFESLSERLQNAIKMFRGTKEITEEDLKAPLREVRMALLEADVNFKVVKNFVAKIKERALGAEIQQNLSPSQQIIKIVDEELTELLGGTQAKLTVADKPPTIIMLVGLQGTGKTTTVGKLAFNLKKEEEPAAGSCRRIPSGCDYPAAGIGRAGWRAGVLAGERGVAG